MGDKPVPVKAESTGSGASWADISSSIFSGPSLLTNPRDAVQQGLQTIKEGASAVNKAATSAGNFVEGVVEGGLQAGTAGATAVVGAAVDAVAGKKAGNAVRAGAHAAIDGAGNAADAVTRAALGEPQARIAEMAADVALGAMTGGAGGAAAKSARAATRSGGDAKAAPADATGGELVIQDIFSELKIPKSLQKTGEKIVDEIKQTPSDVYNHLKNNPWRAVPIGVLGGLGPLVFDAKMSKNK